jgi:hypothetical protein
MASEPVLPDPDGSDPAAVSSDGGATSDTPAADSSPSPSSVPTVAGDTSAPLSGIWCNNQDPQFLIQWSLQEVPAAQPAASAAAQPPAPGTYAARVRIFQEIFGTGLAVARPVVPFSLRDAVDPNPYLQGSLVLLQQPSGPPPMLLVKNLRFSGFQQAQVVLYPADQGIAGEESRALGGGTAAPGGSGGEE